MKYQNQKSGIDPICYSNKKNKVARNKLSQGGKRPVLRKLHNTEEIANTQLNGIIYHVHGLKN